MNFSRVPRWAWWVGGAALIVLLYLVLTVKISVDLPPLIPPPPK
jgi:hypothetical protein